MKKVKIVGAGSIGNHLAHACRDKSWDVTICDVDQAALDRTKSQTYPDRYGSWDDEIKLILKNNDSGERYDLIFIGTPPDSHINLAIESIKSHQPKVVMIEKPLCGPNLIGAGEILSVAEQYGVFVGVGYNHRLTENTIAAVRLLSTNDLGKPLSIMAKTREHWGGIFGAHPWLSGPEDTYLGYYARGGGACGEHSHAINIWQYFAELLGQGRVIKVSAVMDIVNNGKAEYDQSAFLTVTTESGLIGNIVQDVVTQPAQKKLRVQFEKGAVEWYVNIDSKNDAVRYIPIVGNEDQIIKIPKKRPDDFKGEINHVEDLLNNKISSSPISLTNGLETMMVISAAYRSDQLRKEVTIDYSKGFNLNAISN